MALIAAAWSQQRIAFLTAKILTLADVNAAIAGSTAAFRCRTRLHPAGGESSKVFPPTYKGGPYATEERVIHVEENGEKKVVKVPTVLLDSVQSQANRMELALLQGYREKRLKFPLIEVEGVPIYKAKDEVAKKTGFDWTVNKEDAKQAAIRKSRAKVATTPITT